MIKYERQSRVTIYNHSHNNPPGNQLESKTYAQVGMLTGTRVPGTRIYYPNPGS